ncbi:MAG: hypothetical protein FWK04_21980 [Nostoc sp. GBBB01]|nr:hypothetical protein [Nostoc sp. GBBB01]
MVINPDVETLYCNVSTKIFILISATQGGKGKGEREKGKGERGKGEGERFQIHPLPLNLFPDHKGISCCLSEPY